MTINSNNNQKAALAQAHIQDSLNRIDSLSYIAQKRKQDSINKIAAAIAKDTTINQDSIKKVAVAKEKLPYGAFYNSSKGENIPVVIQNEKLKATIYPRGGRIGEVELKGIKTSAGKPLILFSADSTHFGLAFFDQQRRRLNTDSLYFHAEGKGFTVEGKDSSAIAFRLYADSSNNSRYIEYLYSLRGNSNLVGCAISFVGFDKIFPDDQTDVDLNWSMNPPSQEKSIDNQRTVETVFYNFDGEEGVENLKEHGDDARGATDADLKSANTKWVSFKQQYFSSILFAKNKFDKGAEMGIRTPTNLFEVKAMSTTLPIVLQHKATETFPMTFYFGPNKFSELKSYNLHFEREINLGVSIFGWLNRFIFIPLFTWLSSNIANYGLVILLLTIIVKIFLFPIAYKAFLSSAKMRVMKPEIDQINEKFGKEEPLKKQQATMQLYKKAGINPASGCIPLLLQIPILFTLIRLFPAAYELRQAHFLWCHDLSSYDSVLDFGFKVPLYGDHVSMFALLMTVSTLLYTWMNQQMLTPGSAQMPGMKWLIYIMPFMFLGFLNSYCAALSYYYFVSNIITFTQMFVMRRYVDHDAIRAKIDENQKKPVKQSGFMQRLEAAQRKRLEDMKQQQNNKGGNNKKKK